MTHSAPRGSQTVGLSDFLSHISFFAERNVAAGGRLPVRGKPTRRRSGVSAHYLSPTGIVSRPGASAFFVSDGPISSNSGRNGGKNAGRNCVSALPQRAIPVHCHPRFPSRNRRFPDRCRSPDCASTAFRCRCLLLRQKLFVLPCRRLRNHYILCPTGTPTFAAARRQRRDLIIANASSAPDPTLAPHQRQRRRRYKQSPEPTMLPTALHARVHTAKSA